MILGRVAMIAATAVGGLLVAAPPAGAAAPRFAGLTPSSFTEVYSPNDVPLPGGGRSATARCPGGMADVSVGGLGAVPLGSITPGADGASAVATTDTALTTQSWSAISVVTCAPLAQFAGTTFATVVLRGPIAGTVWTASAPCPTGMRAFAGGGYFRTSSGAPSTTSQRMIKNTVSNGGRNWKVSAVHPAFLTDTLVVTARCAPESSSTRLLEISVPMKPNTAQPGVFSATEYARCAAGYLPISGGVSVETTMPSGSFISTSVPVRNGEIGWFGGASSTDPNARLHVVALCGTG